MLNQFLLAINVVLPLFVVIGFGYLLAQLKMVEKNVFKQLNSLVFSVILPLHIFNSLYKASTQNYNFTNTFFPVIISVFLVLFVILVLIVPRYEKDPKRQGVIIQGIIRVNFIIIAFPIMDSLFGLEWVPLGSIILAMTMILLNPLAVIALSIFSNKTVKYRHLLKDIIKNPLIIGTIFGLIFMNFSVTLPVWLGNGLDMIAGLGTPLALICLGGLFNLSSIKHNFKLLSIVVLIKMVLLPLLVLLISLFFKFTLLETMIAIILFAAPTAVTTYPMADAMGSDGELAQHIVITTTLLSSLILIFWISIVHFFH